MLIRNFDKLAASLGRKAILQIVEAGLEAIQPEKVIGSLFMVHSLQLEIAGQKYDLKNYDRVFLMGFGKGSAGISELIEKKLGDRLTGGWVNDLEIPDQAQENKLKFFRGTHPLPSEQNVEFTKNLITQLTQSNQLTPRDLVVVVICGGGSALFTYPQMMPVSQVVQVNQALLKSGATIAEMNVVRKKLDRVKGGGLAKILYPATVASLIFSDVPGNDLSTIASGPTVKDLSTVDEAWAIVEKFNLSLKKEDLVETPKEEKFFEKVHNILVLSNMTAIQAMSRRAQDLGYQVSVFSDRLQGEAKHVGAELIKLTSDLGERTVIIAGGETTVKVTGGGKGGRNQELVLGALLEMGGQNPFENQIKVGFGRAKMVAENPEMEKYRNVIVASFDSDGWDNSDYAGAIGDISTLEKANSNNYASTRPSQ